MYMYCCNFQPFPYTSEERRKGGEKENPGLQSRSVALGPATSTPPATAEKRKRGEKRPRFRRTPVPSQKKERINFLETQRAGKGKNRRAGSRLREAALVNVHEGREEGVHAGGGGGGGDLYFTNSYFIFSS